MECWVWGMTAGLFNDLDDFRRGDEDTLLGVEAGDILADLKVFVVGSIVLLRLVRKTMIALLLNCLSGS
jgi:hypothetical protein